MLTGGEAHDFPLAKRLIRRVTRRHLLGDMAYDGDELREELERHRTKSVIPNRPKEGTRSASKTPLQASMAHRERLQQVEATSAVSQLATTSWGETTSHLSALPQPLYGGFNRV